MYGIAVLRPKLPPPMCPRLQHMCLCKALRRRWLKKRMREHKKMQSSQSCNKSCQSCNKSCQPAGMGTQQEQGAAG